MADKGARSVPQLRIPGAGARKGQELPTIVGPAITPKEQWPLPPGSAAASSPRPLVAPPRPPRPESKDTLNLPIQGASDAIVKQAPPQDSNRLTIPDGSEFNFPTPNNSRPMTGASVASTSSRYSGGEDEFVPDVPQFPQQLADDLQQDERYSQQVQQQQNRQPLGPPPSARRGPASYYSQHAAVDIIEEETNSERASTRLPSEGRTSVAWSAAMDHDVPDYYRSSLAAAPKTIGQFPIVAPKPAAAPIPRVPPGRQFPPPSQSSPPRKAISRPPPPAAQDSTSTKSSGVLGRYHSSMYPRSSYGSEKTMSVKFDSGTNHPMPDMKEMRPTTHLPAVAYDISHGDGDPRVNSILGRLTKGGALGYGDDDDSDSDQSVSDAPPLAQPQHRQQHSGAERPGTRGKDGRASMTSLPGMIRRATTLASNLDRGRTASRIGTQWFDSEKRPQQGWQRQSMYSDAFPPSAFPGHHSQPLPPVPHKSPFWAWPWQRARGSRTMSYFRDGQGRLRQSMTRKLDADPSEKRIWGFTVPMLFFMGTIVTLLLLAAILLPIVLIALPGGHKSNDSAESVQALTQQSCQTQMPCANNGLSAVDFNATSCQCLCVNGYTGMTCSEPGKNECTGIDTDSAKNLTVGTAMPRLFTGASANYSIILDLKTILGLFSTTNLTCASENALVTFNGLMTRSIDEPDLAKRQNGIVFASSTSADTSPTDKPTTSAGSPSSTLDMRALDVARIAVLVILQDSNQLNDAIITQQALQDFFVTGYKTGADPSNIEIGNGYSVNLKDGKITAPNGKQYGQRIDAGGG